MRAIVWPLTDDTEGAKFEIVDIPRRVRGRGRLPARHELLETIAHVDDALLEKYLADEEITYGRDPERAASRRAQVRVRARAVRVGVQEQGRAAHARRGRRLPPVAARPSAHRGHRHEGRGDRRAQGERERAVRGARVQDRRRPLREAHLLPHLLGPLDKGAEIYNSTKDRKERIGRILRMHADQREDIDVAYAGDIVAGLGFKQTTTGDTLCDRAHPIILERMEFPTPVISVAIEPKTKNDQDKLGKALNSLSDEDPTFLVHTDEDTGQTIIAGMGELAPRGVGRPHDARVQRRRARGQAPGRVPRDDHQERREGRAALRPPDRWSGPVRPRRDRARAHRARRWLRVRRRDQGWRDPREYIPAVDAGIQEAMQGGVLAGYPLVDVRVRLTFGSYHDVDSSEMAFKIAGSMAFKEAARRAKPQLLEPVASVEVVTAEEYMGDVIGDLSSRRGKIGGMEQRGNSQVINATVPIAEMFGYATDLRSRTQGRATYTMQFDSYQPVPESISLEIIARVRGE